MHRSLLKAQNNHAPVEQYAAALHLSAGAEMQRSGRIIDF
jgi:hypothetical protein